MAEQERTEAEQVLQDAYDRVEQMREELRVEEQNRIYAELAEKNQVHQKELKILEEELGRIAGQLQGVQKRVGQMGESL